MLVKYSLLIFNPPVYLALNNPKAIYRSFIKCGRCYLRGRCEWISCTLIIAIDNISLNLNGLLYRKILLPLINRIIHY